MFTPCLPVGIVNMVTTLPCCTCFMIILRSRVYSLVYLFTLLFLQIHVRNNQNLKLVLHLRDARGRLFDNFTSLSVSWSSSNTSLARFPDLSKSVNMMFLRVKEDENVQRSVCKYRGHFSNSLVEKKLWILVSLIIFSPSVSKKKVLLTGIVVGILALGPASLVGVLSMWRDFPTL